MSGPALRSVSEKPLAWGGLPIYAESMGFASAPFPVTPDESRYFCTPAIESIFAEALHFIESRRGFLLLTGEIGLGKTTFVRKLLSSLDAARYNTALLLTSFLDKQELLQAISADFGLQVPASANRMAHLSALNAFLLLESEKGKINVLIIDDAQALDEDTLDLIRQLSNLETAQEKLLQVVLVGQPELADVLNRHSLRQLKSRVALFRTFNPLTQAEVKDYVEHRLASASAEPDKEGVTLQDDALGLLHQMSGGVPRRIHHLLDRCLFGLYARGSRNIDTSLLKEAWNDLWLDQVPLTQASTASSFRTDMAGLRRRLTGKFLAGVVLVLVALLALGGAHLNATGKPLAFSLLSGAVPVSALQAIAAPPEWSGVHARPAELEKITWPVATNFAELKLRLAALGQPLGWQPHLFDAAPVKTCPERQVMTLRDSGGGIVYLVWLEADLPLQAVAFGERSAGLKGAQSVLASLDALDEDGIMGRRTADLLARFQRSHRLAATGQFDALTAYHLSCAQAVRAPGRGEHKGA